MDCVNCGAPLPAKSTICTHCETRNDVDLRAIERASETGPETDLICPRCDDQLTSVALHIDGRMHIERCDKCLGIFFNPGELEAIVDTSVDNVFEVQHERLRNLIEEEAPADFESVTYIECPVCAQLMNRKAHGSRAGVIVDSCKEHGIWLDGGELGRILKWAKAGGKKHNDIKKDEQRRKDERKQRQAGKAAIPYSIARDLGSSDTPYALGHLLRLVFRLLT